MPYTEAEIDAFRRDLKGLHEEASKFFSEIVEAFEDVHLMRFDGPDVRSNLTPDAQATALRLRERLKSLVLGRMMEIARQSPLLSEHDRTDLEIAMRRMAAALQFERYYHWDEVLHDERNVLGVRPRGQSEDQVEPNVASENFRLGYQKMLETVDLLSPTSEGLDLPSELLWLTFIILVGIALHLLGCNVEISCD